MQFKFKCGFRSGGRSSLIVTKFDRPTVDVIRFVNPEKVLLMSATKDNALISSAKIGIGFEYGRDEDESTYRETLDGIKDILAGLGMIDAQTARVESRTKFYRISESLNKEPGFVLEKNIRNFSLVQEGQVVARNGEREVLAPKDFYPVLFGENTYTEIFGFMGERIDFGWQE